MNGRELVILLLGLAIVAVVLRGLYVAINARRGQIKLAIDKNIPQNVDLESLELAELPGGGARVVTRSLEEVNRQNNALDRAETKAQFLNLTDAEIDGHIPVLMDAVELSQTTVARGIPAQEYQQEVEVAEYKAAEKLCSKIRQDLVDARRHNNLKRLVPLLEQYDKAMKALQKEKHDMPMDWQEKAEEALPDALKQGVCVTSLPCPLVYSGALRRVHLLY